MAEAARFYEEVPAALKLRELQTLVDIAREKTLIIVTPSGESMTGTIAAMCAALQKPIAEREAEVIESARLAAMKGVTTEVETNKG